MSKFLQLNVVCFLNDIKQYNFLFVYATKDHFFINKTIFYLIFAGLTSESFSSVLDLVNIFNNTNMIGKKSRKVDRLI